MFKKPSFLYPNLRKNLIADQFCSIVFKIVIFSLFLRVYFMFSFLSL